MVVVPINTDLNMEEYWQLNPRSIEWLYVVKKLGESVQAKYEDKHCLMGTSLDGTTLYLLSKKFYTPVTISKATGLSVAKLENYNGVITLKEPKDSIGKPAPTVAYWGEA